MCGILHTECVMQYSPIMWHMKFWMPVICHTICVILHTKYVVYDKHYVWHMIFKINDVQNMQYTTEANTARKNEIYTKERVNMWYTLHTHHAGCTQLTYKDNKKKLSKIELWWINTKKVITPSDKAQTEQANQKIISVHFGLIIWKIKPVKADESLNLLYLYICIYITMFATSRKKSCPQSERHTKSWKYNC